MILLDTRYRHISTIEISKGTVSLDILASKKLASCDEVLLPESTFHPKAIIHGSGSINRGSFIFIEAEFCNQFTCRLRNCMLHVRAVSGACLSNNDLRRNL